MSQAHFALSWDAHKNHICHGLSSLQQDSEFVDMTLAADGHFVKVHRVVMALASPYIKELMASAQCTHPVIFLNKVSYATLRSILEYIYFGEVLVDRENINELVEAAKELRIRGLEDMKVELASVEHQPRLTLKQGKPIQNRQSNVVSQLDESRNYNTFSCEVTGEEFTEENYDQVEVDQSLYPIESDQEMIQDTKTEGKAFRITEKAVKNPRAMSTQIQYTVTNQGALSMILNRYMYYLRYTSRKPVHGHRSWRCVNCTKESSRCPAGVITKDDMVIRRFGVHNHPFHDEKILKKVRDRAVFTTLVDAETTCAEKKRQREDERNASTPAKKSRTDADTTDHE